MEGWVARDVVRHLVEWFPAFLEGAAGITLPAGPSVDDDPVGAWRTQTDAVQALLDDADTADREHDLPHIGRMQQLVVLAAEQFVFAKASLWWLILMYGVISLGELMLSPMGLALVSKVAPIRMRGLMMGGWFAATAIGNKLTGVGEYWDLWSHSYFFILLAGMAFAMAVVLVRAPPSAEESHARSLMQLQENVPLAPLTTIGIGGPARFFFRATSVDDVLEALAVGARSASSRSSSSAAAAIC